MSNIVLETRNVGDVDGKFFLPAYQPGYRWGEDEIRLMLDDLYENGTGSYCLQPIVVKKCGNRYELIDGQQRLTTVYLIYQYFSSKLSDIYEPQFSLEYETRVKSGEYLRQIKDDTARASQRDENIDFFHIANAYETIRDYFEKDRKTGEKVRVKPARLTTLNQYFDDNVKFIWYEVDSEEDGVELFERLNIGKIALTSSELVKALFLRAEAEGEMSGRQEEIALQWDAMEHALHDPAFWTFLTKEKPETYPTRIDLVLDLISEKARDKKDKKETYHTFFYFDKLIKNARTNNEEDALINIWNRIHHVYLTLREWYADHDFYHKIGYLVNSGSKSLAEIYSIWRSDDSHDPLSKRDFSRELDTLISKSIELPDAEALADLSYSSNYSKLQTVLLLFNVETERLKDEGKRRFPFDKHRDGHWSLEHIHAQQSESLKNNQLVLQWLKDHENILGISRMDGWEELRDTLREFREELERNPESSRVRERFKEVQSRTVAFFSRNDDIGDSDGYRDNIANLALLDGAQNAALSNYVFDAKREMMMEYDRQGRYIPFCTKMVFFKYYSPASASLHYWGEEDRQAYLAELDRILSPYYTPKEQPLNNQEA